MNLKKIKNDYSCTTKKNDKLILRIRIKNRSFMQLEEQSLENIYDRHFKRIFNL